MRQPLLVRRINHNETTDLARIKYYERDYEGAIAAYNEVLEKSPDFYWSLLFRGIAFEQQGLYEEAAGSIVRALRVSGREETASTLERAFAAEGYDGLLRAWKAFWLANQWRAQSTTIAMISVRLGDFDEAFRWLERAFEERPRYLVNLEVEPQFDTIRSDPRFEDLLRRMHFPGH